ncbi:hypothetical protein AHAS_Ahas02G0124000 [Arachis hypogaea]
MFSFMEKTEANFKNQGASLKNLAVQISQLAHNFHTHSNTSSDTILNTREECKAIYLRSKKMVGEKKKEEIKKEEFIIKERMEATKEIQQEGHVQPSL